LKNCEKWGVFTKNQACQQPGELPANHIGMRAAVFLERDGILTLPKMEGKAMVTPHSLEDVVVNEAAMGPLRQLKRAGFRLIATTNQPGISRGYIFRREVDRIHDYLTRAFDLDDLVMCPHDEMDRCPCRKPKPGLLREAAFKWKLNLDHCFVISEKWQDAKMAHNAGCTSLMVRSPLNGCGHHDFVLPTIESVVAKALQLQQSFFAIPELLRT
jgi:D-glycero-D-manno-heptose 1,7-bisphosphate phosphatase